MSVIFMCGFECGVGQAHRPNHQTPNIVFGGPLAPLVDGIYDYEIRGELLEVTRTYKGVTEVRTLAAGDSAWGIQWSGHLPEKEKK